MDDTFVRHWMSEINGVVDALVSTFEERFGYPPGENAVSPPAIDTEITAVRDLLTALAMPDDLALLYSYTGEVALADVGNGYFIHDPRLVCSLYERASPRYATVPDGAGSTHTVEVIAFASDGGGALYVLAAPTGSPVHRLPPGRIDAGTYTGEHLGGAFGPVADNLADFLDRLVAAAKAFEAGGVIAAL